MKEKENFLDYSILTTSYGINEEILVPYIKKLLLVIKSTAKYFGNIVYVFEKKEEKLKTNLEKIFPSSSNPIKFLINPSIKRGFSVCLNFGIRNTSANFILRCDPDDIFLDNKIYVQISKMYSSKADISYTDIKTIYGISNYPKNIRSFLFKLSLGFNPIAHTSVAFKRDLFGMHDIYDEKIVFAEDLDVWIKAIIQGKKFIHIDKPFTRYSVDNTSKKIRNNAKAQIKIRMKYLVNLLIICLTLISGILFSFARLLIPLHHFSIKIFLGRMQKSFQKKFK